MAHLFVIHWFANRTWCGVRGFLGFPINFALTANAQAMLLASNQQFFLWGDVGSNGVVFYICMDPDALGDRTRRAGMYQDRERPGQRKTHKLLVYALSCTSKILECVFTLTCVEHRRNQCNSMNFTVVFKTIFSGGLAEEPPSAKMLHRSLGHIIPPKYNGISRRIQWNQSRDRNMFNNQWKRVWKLLSTNTATNKSVCGVCLLCSPTCAQASETMNLYQIMDCIDLTMFWSFVNASSIQQQSPIHLKRFPTCFDRCRIANKHWTTSRSD